MSFHEKALSSFPSASQLSPVEASGYLNSIGVPTAIAGRGCQSCKIMNLPPLPYTLAKLGRSSEDTSNNTAEPAAISNKEVVLGACETCLPPPTTLPQCSGDTT